MVYWIGQIGQINCGVFGVFSVALSAQNLSQSFSEILKILVFVWVMIYVAKNLEFSHHLFVVRVFYMDSLIMLLFWHPT